MKKNTTLDPSRRPYHSLPELPAWGQYGQRWPEPDSWAPGYEELAPWFNKWFITPVGFYPKSGAIREEVWTVREVEKETARNMYGHPVNCLHIALTNYSSYTDKTPASTYRVYASLQSRKAQALHLEFSAPTLPEAITLRNELMAFIDLYPVIDADIWEMWAEEKGGKLEWW
jgi:hypothetical protein